ncbi:hypothetical protein KR054_007169 [Drosophila jambulina]|nr:hypothetical protein KR054_007169 [Drosophila jambulina]
MLMKVLNINGVNYVTSCTVAASRSLTFYCHNEGAVQTFVETLPIDDFQQRLLSLNPRVKFPENAVRDTLLEGDTSQAAMAAEPNSDGVWVLTLKYSMAETPAPLKWEWHLKPMDTVKFYRQLLGDAIDVGHELQVLVSTLTKDLCAKDKELEQYRREGFQLRRTTVRTKTFDLLEFNEENKDLFEEAAAYKELGDIFPSNFPASYSHSRGEVASNPTTPSTTASSKSSSSVSGRTTSSPSSSSAPERATTSSSSATAARCRKRKAQAINIDRLERKIKQRFQQPQLKYNSQSSQEDELADWLVEGALNGVIKEEQQSEQKPKLDVTIKTETEAETSAEAAAEIAAEVAAKVAAEVATETAAEAASSIKTEKLEEPEEATAVPEEENNNESLTDSDQELNELRSILAASMGQKREKRE